MRRIIDSFSYAWEGLVHTLQYERNFRLFSIGFAVLILISWTLQLEHWEIVAFLSSGIAFMVVELINTAIERLTDAVDSFPKTGNGSELHQSMKAAKDVAAAASLMALLAFGVVVVITIGHHLMPISNPALGSGSA